MGNRLAQPRRHELTAGKQENEAAGTTEPHSSSGHGVSAWRRLPRWMQALLAAAGASCVGLGVYQWQVGVCIPIVLAPSVGCYLMFARRRAKRQRAASRSRSTSPEQVEVIPVSLLIRSFLLGAIPVLACVVVAQSLLALPIIHTMYPAYYSEVIGLTKPASFAADPAAAPPYGLSFLDFPATPKLLLFIAIQTILVAGGVEEVVKFAATRWSVRQEAEAGATIPAHTRVERLCAASVAIGLGFAVMENLGFLVVAAESGSATGTSLLSAVQSAVGRSVFGSISHALFAYNSTMESILTEQEKPNTGGEFSTQPQGASSAAAGSSSTVLSTPIHTLRSVGASVCIHGAWNFVVFTTFALRREWSTGRQDDMFMSYAIIGAIGAVLIAPPAAISMWNKHKKVRQLWAADIEERDDNKQE